MTIIATSNASIYVTDQNNNPVVGAGVFINGISSGITAAGGVITAALPANNSSVSIQVSMNGYQTYTGSIQSNITSTVINLISTTPTAVPISLVLETPGAMYTVTGTGGFSDNGTIGSSNSVTTSIGYLPGSYSISWSFQGVNRTDVLTVIAGTTVYNFNPLPVADSGANSAGAATNATSAGTVTAPNTSSTNNYPFTYPAYNYGKYFTPTQAFIYIGELFIDELAGFQYTLQDNKVPVFGYCSRKMDGVGNGKSIIQGQLNINYISEGYLYTVLNEFKLSNTPTVATSTSSSAQTSAINLYQQYIALSASPNLVSVQSQLTAIRQQLNQLMANNSSLPSVLASVQSQAHSNSPNAVYTDIPFDIVIQFEGGGRTIEQKIERCFLTSNEQILGDNDSTVLDSYGFLARSIGYRSIKPNGTVSILPGFTQV